ncbi:Trm112 family protein [Rhodococcus marinonascens]|uniref:Trm112 family protein n=1 Tax=Rhodococcus marinonascens TaxID=38311 RepID=UPI0009344E25|nr:Trm112 family protein [Rhodococcus marinonascens]
MEIDATLLDILACPEDKGPLLLIEDVLLYNPRLRRAYPIENGIPVLLIDEARDVGAEEHESLLGRVQGES